MLKIFIMFFLNGIIFFQSHSIYAKDLLITSEQNADRIGFYNSDTGKSEGNIRVGFIPHEIIVSKDLKTAFVSNFGLQDYDEKIGVPGNSISIINIPARLEIFRLYTSELLTHPNSLQDKAPHGLQLRPPHEKQLYVNVEKSNKLLVFDIASKKIIKKLNVNPDTHNFIFSPDGKQLFLMAGKSGIIRINPDTGEVTGKLELSTPVRGLIYSSNKNSIIASGKNEIAIVNPHTLAITAHYKNLGVGQILYSGMTPDGKYIVAPAVWDSQIIVINTQTGKVIKRIVTGLDPVTVKISSSGKFAYVTNARDNFITKINLTTFEKQNIYTKDGPNGLAIIPMDHSQLHYTLHLGVALPLSGKYSVKGREMMLGYEFWRMAVQKAGGVLINNYPYDIDLIYLDTQSDINRTIQLTNELINKYKIDVLLPSYGNDANKILSGLAHEQNIPFLSLKRAAKTTQENDEFQQQFLKYYNLKSTQLSEDAYTTGKTLIDSLFKNTPPEITRNQSNLLDLEKLHNSRINVITKYVDLLGDGNYLQIPSLFSIKAIAVSSSGIEDNPTHFYKTLFTETIKSPSAKLLNIFPGTNDMNVFTVQFYFSWINKKGERVAAEFLDLIYFEPNETKINKLQVFSNTFRNDIMKQFNQQSR